MFRLLALRSFTVVVQELLAKDPGTHGMPALPFFAGGEMAVPLIITFDATGFGTQQFNTIAVRNPYLPHSAQLLRIFGLGNCSDNKSGTTRLLGPNLELINKEIERHGSGEATDPDRPKLKVRFSSDVSALRHTEHLINSGWCSCSRDFCLRKTPKKPKDIAAMHTLLLTCHSPTMTERFVKSHNPLPGKLVPEPCTAAGCTFAHNPATAEEELRAERAEEAELAADDTKKGKARFAKWRLAHAHTHGNIQPGLHGKPMFHHDLDDQILETSTPCTTRCSATRRRPGSMAFSSTPHLTRGTRSPSS